MAELTRKQRSQYLKQYQQQCMAEVDAYNREHDTDYTITEAMTNGKKGRGPQILTHPAFEAFLEDKFPERGARRRRRQAQREAQQRFASLPLRERLKFGAVSELTLLLRQHAENMEQLEAELELEMEDEHGMGLF